jgi:hypothetical protein
MTEAHKRRRPAPYHEKPASKNKRHHSTLVREFIGMAIAALIFAATMWSSVFGMSGGFAPTSEVVLAAAGVGADE